MLPTETKSEFKFRFLGPNEIGAEELGAFLTETANLFNKVATITESDVNLKLNVTTIEKGSFLITLSTALKSFPKLFGYIKEAKDVISAVKEILELKEFLKNDKIKEIKENQIITNNGKIRDIVYQPTYYIFKDEKKRKEIDKTVTKFAEKIPNRQLNFENNEEIFEITSEVKQNLMEEIEYSNNDDIKVNTQEIERELVIKKPDLTMRSQWEFVGDKVIKATIEDDEFKKYVLSGNFKTYCGHKLKVKMEERTIYTSELEPLDTHYKILKVYLDGASDLKLL